jgi:predicted RNase H-like HicB family nuclease
MPSSTKKKRSKRQSSARRSAKKADRPHAQDYQVVVRWSAQNGCFLAFAPALQGCRTHGDTAEQALRNGLEVAQLWLDDAVRNGDPIPRPLPAHAGRMTLRLPASLHHRIAECAERDGVSINQWVITKLAEAS